MESNAFQDHFSERSQSYAEARPNYPAELAAWLAGKAPGNGLAVDCGCGNGQLSVLLAEHFDEVAASDASVKQIEAAIPHERVTYRVATAENSGVESRSADLITAAQAAHWFDMDRFYAEVRRIARPDALLALICYGVMSVADSEADEAVQDFYWHIIGKHWPADRRHVEQGYRTLPFPFPELAQPDLAIERHWLRSEIIAYMRTWSGAQQAEKALGHDVVGAFAAKLTEVWPDDVRFLIRWPITVRAAHLV